VWEGLFASTHRRHACALGRLTRKYFKMLSPSVEASGWRQTLHCRVPCDAPGSTVTRTTL
jgi:hypothetical protein